MDLAVDLAVDLPPCRCPDNVRLQAGSDNTPGHDTHRQSRKSTGAADTTEREGERERGREGG